MPIANHYPLQNKESLAHKRLYDHTIDFEAQRISLLMDLEIKTGLGACSSVKYLSLRLEGSSMLDLPKSSYKKESDDLSRSAAH